MRKAAAAAAAVGYIIRFDPALRRHRNQVGPVPWPTPTVSEFYSPAACRKKETRTEVVDNEVVITNSLTIERGAQHARDRSMEAPEEASSSSSSVAERPAMKKSPWSKDEDAACCGSRWGCTPARHAKVGEHEEENTASTSIF